MFDLGSLGQLKTVEEKRKGLIMQSWPPISVLSQGMGLYHKAVHI